MPDILLITQSCPALCNLVDCSLCSQNSPGKNTGVGCHSLLQWIFLTQKLNPGLLHCRWILYHLRHQESQCGAHTNFMQGLAGFPDGSDGKESTCKCRRPGFDPSVRKIPWRRERLSTPVFLPGKSYGQRSLIGYSPWSHKELDITE